MQASSCHQTWSEFDPQNLYNGRGETTSTNCPLTFMWALWHATQHKCTKQISKCKNIKTNNLKQTLWLNVVVRALNFYTFALPFSKLRKCPLVILAIKKKSTMTIYLWIVCSLQNTKKAEVVFVFGVFLLLLFYCGFFVLFLILRHSFYFSPDRLGIHCVANTNLKFLLSGKEF